MRGRLRYLADGLGNHGGDSSTASRFRRYAQRRQSRQGGDAIRVNPVSHRVCGYLCV